MPPKVGELLSGSVVRGVEGQDYLILPNDTLL